MKYKNQNESNQDDDEKLIKVDVRETKIIKIRTRSAQKLYL